MLLRKNPSEKNRDVFYQDNKLPSPRTEAKALFRMVGRNGDSLESLRALIEVGENVKQMMFKNAPDEKEVRRMLLFREQVLAVFDELVAKQEKKALRHSRLLVKHVVPTNANLTGTNLNTIIP